MGGCACVCVGGVHQSRLGALRYHHACTAHWPTSCLRTQLRMHQMCHVWAKSVTAGRLAKEHARSSACRVGRHDRCAWTQPGCRVLDGCVRLQVRPADGALCAPCWTLLYRKDEHVRTAGSRPHLGTVRAARMASTGRESCPAISNAPGSGRTLAARSTPPQDASPAAALAVNAARTSCCERGSRPICIDSPSGSSPLGVPLPPGPLLAVPAAA